MIGDPNAQPVEGDLTVCIRCAAVLIFDADLKLELFTGTLDAEATVAILKIQQTIKHTLDN